VSVLYIHGYNVSFELAALRAAQLGADLKIDGIMSFFSWPSKGKFTGYPPDEASIEASEEPLTAYLAQLAGCLGDGALHIIAHSMGNRALLRSMKELLNRVESKQNLKLGQIFLAAPDVDARVFANLARVFKSLSERTTLYVSPKDKALASSGILHDYPRAGFTPPVTTVDGIDTVDTSSVDLSFLGHGYFAASRDVLEDMYTLLRHNLPPLDRQLSQEVSDGHPYWSIPYHGGLSDA
jgi:esterase/lipase superfamily enzyme